ncbi:hypothetical protein V8C43DRAFT_126692 [Trichoderma afarasin]
MTYRYPVGKLGCLSFFFVIYSFVFCFPVLAGFGLGIGMVFRDKAIHSGWVDSFGSWFSFGTLMLGIVRCLFPKLAINDAVFCCLYNLFSCMASSTNLGFGGEEC